MHSRIPSKTIRDFRPKQAKSMTVFKPNGAKTIPFGAAHTYKANIREYPPPPPGISLDEITWEDRKFTANGPHQWLSAFQSRSFACGLLVEVNESKRVKQLLLTLLNLKPKLSVFSYFYRAAVKERRDSFQLRMYRYYVNS